MYLISYLILDESESKKKYYSLIDNTFNLMNIDMKIHGNIQNFNNKSLLIMSNHYQGVIDSTILYKMYYKTNKKNTLFTVVKSNLLGDKTDKNMISNILYYIKDYLMNSLYFLPYTRGDKTDGNLVKNKINEYLNNDKNVLIFPEGKITKRGIPDDFKHGIFKLAVENKLNILPITIKYEKEINLEDNDPLENSKMFDNTVNLYIHDIIDSKNEECYKKNDFIGLKNKTYDIICHPFKETNTTIINKTSEETIKKDVGVDTINVEE